MDNQSDKNFNNIHLYTNNLRELDGFVTKMREHLANEGIDTKWILKPFLKALVETAFKFESTSTTFEKGLSLLINPFLIYFTTFLGISNFAHLSKVPFLQDIASYWWFVVAGILYIISVVKGFNRQLDYSDPNFDLNAFKSTFPELYRQIRVFKNTEPFSFEALHAHVERLSEMNLEKMGIALEQIAKLNDDKRIVTERLNEVERILSRITGSLELTNNHFDKAITALQAINSGQVSKDILHTFGDFTLFKLEGDILKKIASQHTYNTPDTICINDENKREWAVVKAARAELAEDRMHADQSHDRVVIANKYIINKEVFVYAYHLPSRNLDRLSYIATDTNTQTLIYNLILLYTNNKE